MQNSCNGDLPPQHQVYPILVQKGKNARLVLYGDGKKKQRKKEKA
jgi:hypothetical protein